MKKKIVSLQKTLTSIPALSPVNDGDGEEKKAEAIKKILEKIGFQEIMEFNAPDKRTSCGYRPNIIAIKKGKSSEKTIWLMSHMDVVPPGDLKLWDSDPYKIKVDAGKIYGRGTEDNQQGIVSSLIALQAFKDEKILPEYDVGLVLVADEETGSDYGLSYVLSEFSGFKKEDFIIVPDSGSPDGSLIEIAEKSILWIEFTTTGKQCHASRPAQGINSFKAASNLVVKLEKLYKKFSKKDNLFAPPVSTFEPTKKEANVPNVNTIPGKDVFCLDCRVLPCYKLEQLEETIRDMCNEIEKNFNVKIEMKILQKEQAAPPTKAEAPVVKAIGESIETVYGVTPQVQGIGGGTVAALFRNKGFPVVVWSKFDGLAHQPNEYCLVENVMGDAKVFSHIMLQE